METTTKEAQVTTTPDQITTHIPRYHAEILLRIAGLEKAENGRYGGRYWEIDEALRQALLEIADADSSDR